MTTIVAPTQLPLAPRPIADELFSSWLLRVAAANCVTLQELLDGLDSVYPGMPPLVSIDLDLPPLFLRSLSVFCRVSVDRLQSLDLAQRLPHLDRALLLEVSGKIRFSSRAGGQRVGYAFCPLCIAEQRIIHLHWSWCFACIIRCNVHRTPLQLGCAACGESDPLNFAPSQSNSRAHCWNCGADLSQSMKSPIASRDDGVIRVVEDAYRAALLGVRPDVSLLGKVTDRAFRSFVDDMLELLIRCDGAGLIPVKQHRHGPATISRQQLVAVVQDLICSAVPSSTAEMRRRRYHRSLKLWAALISGVPELEGQSLEKASLRWPPPLQRRFEAGLRRRKQQRWPYTPYQGATLYPRFKCREAIAVRLLNAVNCRSTFGAHICQQLSAI